MGTCLAVDGTNILHRAFHAFETTQLHDDEGRASWAVHGFVRMLSTFVEKTNPSSLVVAFDAKGGCPSRRELAPFYKAGRAETPATLHDQLARCQDLLVRMGVACVEAPDWEADDVLASVAHLVSTQGSRCVLVSSDKDAHQLVGENVDVYKPEGVWCNDATLLEKYGVLGSRWVEYAALVGEGADNLPGVTGIGPKRAAGIIQKFDDVEYAIGDIERVAKELGKTVARDLAAGVDAFRVNRKVGTLRRDLALDLSKVHLRHLEVEKAVSVLNNEGLRDAARRFASAMSAF